MLARSANIREHDRKFVVQASYQLTDELIQLVEESQFPFEQTVAGRAGIEPPTGSGTRYSD